MFVWKDTQLRTVDFVVFIVEITHRLGVHPVEIPINGQAEIGGIHVDIAVFNILKPDDPLHDPLRVQIPDIVAIHGEFRRGLRVRQKTDRNCDAGNDCRHHDPECGFAVVHDRPDPILHAHLTEGQRTGGNHAPVDTAMDQGLGIVGSLLIAHLLNDLLITSQFDVPTQQDVG